METATSELLSADTDLLTRFLESQRTQRRLAPLVARLHSELRKHYQNLRDNSIARLRSAWPKKHEALSQADYIALSIYDLGEDEILLARLLSEFYERAGTRGADDALVQTSRMIGRAVIYRGSRAWVRDNAIRFSRKYSREISATTNEAIREQIAEALEKGETLDDVMDRIASVYSEAAGYRSEMIARTEMGRGYNMSALVQDRVIGIDEYDWDGCDPSCPICGPFMDANPHTAAEVELFIANTHPNCTGNQIPTVRALQQVPDSAFA